MLIDLRLLKAVAVAAEPGAGDAPGLQGVYVKWTPEGTEIVASDGCCLIAARLDEREDSGFSAFVPLATVKALKIPAPGRCAAPVWARMAEGFGGKALIDVLDTTPPEVFDNGAPHPLLTRWRETVPVPYSGEIAQFDPALLARLSRADRAMGGSGRIGVRHNGPFAAGVELCRLDHARWFGAVMPYRLVVQPDRWDRA